jgi:hypothetical protein
MTNLREAAQQALEAMGTIGADFICDVSHHAKKNQHNFGEPCPLQQRWHVAYQALRAALAEPQITHSDDCWKWHHECAIARIEETEELREALKAELERTLTDEQISDLWHQSGEQPFKFARMLLK